MYWILALLAATSFTVEIAPPHLTPGAPLRVVVRGADEGAGVTGEFLGQTLRFLPAPGGSGTVAFTGADLLTEPGVHPLTIRVETSGGGAPRTRTLDIRVEPKDYPTERLQVQAKYVEPPREVQERIAEEAAMLNAIWSRATADRLFDGAVKRPLPDVAGRNFGRRRILNGKPRSPHSGIDLSAPTGTPVEAAARGRVVVAQDTYFSGNLVVLDHGGGIYTLYAHLSKMDVARGDEVAAGAVIGRVGATGRVTGPHLHWGARIGRARVDPLSLLDLLSF